MDEDSFREGLELMEQLEVRGFRASGLAALTLTLLHPAVLVHAVRFSAVRARGHWPELLAD